MLRERRRSRPPQSLRASWLVVTARVRRLVDSVHDGNLLEASVHSGVPYARLREIYCGRSKKPDPTILERLARAYGLPFDWFFESSAADDGTVPLAGWLSLFPSQWVDPESDARRMAIPHEAWPLIRVLVQLEQRLRDQPASPSRPIIGTATDPREIRRRVTDFIFQPLRAAQSLGAALPFRNSPAIAESQWVDMLRHLGRFWERALYPMVLERSAGASFGEVA